jgi:hypothetical protein
MTEPIIPVAEALKNFDVLAQQICDAPRELKALAFWAIAEIDRLRANPTQRAMLEAVPDRLMRDIVNDQRRGVSEPSSMATAPGARAPEPRGGTGWIDAQPLKPPPGVDILDRMMDAEDAKDRAAQIVEAAMARRVARPTDNAPPVQPTPAKQSKAPS